MAGRSTTKYALSEYMGHVRKSIADASVSLRIKWFKSVEQLFQQVTITITNKKQIADEINK